MDSIEGIDIFFLLVIARNVLCDKAACGVLIARWGLLRSARNDTVRLRVRLVQRIPNTNRRNVNEARARTASASDATLLTWERFGDVLAFAHKAMAQALGARLAKILARTDAREFVELARIPDAIALARFAIHRNFVAHVEAIARRTNDVTRPARKATLADFFPDGTLVTDAHQGG